MVTTTSHSSHRSINHIYKFLFVFRCHYGHIFIVRFGDKVILRATQCIARSMSSCGLTVYSSVRLSRSCIVSKWVKCILKLFHHLVDHHYSFMAIFGYGSMKKSRSTNISLYLRNDARWGHSYCAASTGTRMRCIKWSYFPRLWMTFIPLTQTVSIQRHASIRR